MSIDDYEFFVGDKVRLVGSTWDEIRPLKSGQEYRIDAVRSPIGGNRLYTLAPDTEVFFDSDTWAVELVDAGPERINRRLEGLRTLMSASGLTTGLDTEQEVELANDSKLPNDLHIRRDDLAAKRADDAQVIATAVGRVEEKLNSAVDRPAPYQFPGGVQPIDIAKHLNFNLGNVVKYVSRAGRKGAALEDLEKAAYYLNLEIQSVRGNDDSE